MRQIIGSLCALVLLTHCAIAEKTKIPYAEAVKIYHQRKISTADLQRQVVMLRVQTQITPRWIKPYRQLADLYDKIGMFRRAVEVARKLASMRSYDVGIQLMLINLESQDYQSIETLRTYLQKKLTQSSLPAEVKSSLYYQLAELSYETFNNRRAIRYLKLALQHAPENLKASALLKQIVEEDPKASITEKYYQRARDLLARIMANPLDAVSQLQLAILAGKMGNFPLTQLWFSQAEKIRKQFAPKQTWPDELMIQLAESYLASGKPEQAIEILKKLRIQSVQSDILLALAYKQTENKQAYDAQIKKLERVISQPKVSPRQLATIALFFTIYTENKASVALQAIKKIDIKKPERLAEIARAFVFLETKQISAAENIAKKLDNKADPFVNLIKIKCTISKGKIAAARKLLTASLTNLPPGPIRDIFVTLAKKTGLTEPPVPDFSKTIGLMKQFNKSYRKFAEIYKSACDVKLTLQGEIAEGEFASIIITLKNKSNVPLTIGPNCFINPAVELQIKESTSDKIRFIAYVLITAKQILPPGRSVSSELMLEEVVPLDRKNADSWDDFIANHQQATTYMRVQAKLISTALLAKPVVLTCAQSNELKVFLPKIDRHSEAILISKLKQPINANPYKQARLAYWLMNSKALTEQKEALTNAIVNQLTLCKSAEVASAFAWSLRASRATGKIFNVLGKLLADDDRFVRFWALDTIGQLQGKQAEKIFEHYAVKDPDASVRQLATAYLLK